MFQKFRATAKNTILYSVSNFAGKLSGVILLPLYTSSLSPDLFGLFVLFEVVYQVIQSITGLGLRGALMRWYWDEAYEGQQKQIFFTVLSTYVLINVVAAFGLYAVFDVLADLVFKANIETNLRIVFIASTFIRLVVEVLLLLMRIQHKAVKHTNYQLIQIFVFVGCIAVFLPLMKLEIAGIFWAFLISYLLLFVLLIPFLKANIDWKYRKDLLKEMMAFGLPLALSNMVNLVLSISDKFIINFFTTLQNVGNYGLAFKISNIVQLMVVNAFMNSYTHVYYKSMSDADNSRFFSRSLTYLVLFLSFVSLGLVLFIENVVNVLTFNNVDYHDSIPLIPVLTIGLIFGGIRSMFTLPLTKYKQTKTISIISVITGIINIGLNILLVPLWGSMGAAISTLVVQFISAFVFWFFARRLESNLGRPIIILMIVALTIIVGGLGYVKVSELFIVEIGYKILLLVIWVVSLFLFRIFDETELTRIKQGWNKWSQLSKISDNLKSLKK